MRTALLPLFALLATPALAAPASDRYDNQWSSPLVVSPAQMHMVRQRNVQLEAGVTSEAGMTKVEDAVASTGALDSKRANDAFFHAVVAAEDKHLRLGVSAAAGTWRGVAQATGVSEAISAGQRTLVAPMAAVELAPLVVGMRVAIEQESAEVSGDPASVSATSVAPQAGLLLQHAGMEGGVAYAPAPHAERQTKTASSDLPATALLTTEGVERPASLVVHGRVRVAPMAAVGAQFHQTYLSRLAPANSYEPPAKDRRTFVLTGELDLGGVRLEGAADYVTATYADDALATPDSIAHFGGSGGAFLRIAGAATFGVAIAGEHGASVVAQEHGIKMSHDTLAVSFSGALSF